MENKFKEGEVVFERIHPSKKLIITAYAGGMYYCKIKDDDRTRKPLIYFERDLMSDAPSLISQ